MKAKPSLKPWTWWAAGAALTGFALVLVVGSVRDPGFWYSADQRGDALFRRAKYKGAAKIYADPMRQGVALYRQGDFEKAAKAFVRSPGAAGAFNQGDALLMHGAYDQAIAAFDRALGFRPDWKEAKENRELAVARRDRIKKQAGDKGADQEPDQIVVDLNAKRTGQKAETIQGGDKLSDAELQATWLRRVQTTPGDFLRYKFAYQAQVDSRDGQKEGP
jgi:Ca-activated chloride channel homolog